jgi:hypothetical protein
VGDGLSILIFGLMSALNPTLLAAVTIMLLLPNPKRLMIGYLLGAYLTSITLGLLIVFELHGSASVSTTKRTLSPIEDLVIGALLVTAGLVLKDQRMRARSERRKAEKAAKAKESISERLLGRGDPRITFFLGVVLTFPGASYLAALAKTSKLEIADAWIVLIVLGLCLLQQLLLEAPIVAYALRPEWAKRAIAGFREWLGRNGRRAAANLAMFLGALLILRGIIELIAGH